MGERKRQFRGNFLHELSKLGSLHAASVLVGMATVDIPMTFVRQFLASFLAGNGNYPKGSEKSGNPIPKMAEQIRLRIYNKLPRYILLPGN